MRWLIVSSIVLVSSTGAAAPRVRFEPTDLELEDRGVLDFDLQVGSFRGNPSRPAVFDSEIDLGLREDVELDVDLAFYRQGDRITSDPIWASMKLGFLDLVDEETKSGWALGAQLGPRVHVAEKPRGIGYEGLLLLGRVWPQIVIVLNGGAIYDAPTRETPHRALGFELGLDAVQPLGKGWSLLWELSSVRQTGEDPHQLYVTFGAQRDFGDMLTVSAIGYYGFVEEGDRIGFLLGVSPKTRIF